MSIYKPLCVLHTLFVSLGETRMKSSVMFSYGPLDRDLPVLDDQEEQTSNSSVWIEDVDWGPAGRDGW